MRRCDIVIRNVPKDLKMRFERDYHLWSAKMVELAEHSIYGEDVHIKKQDFIKFLLDMLEKDFLGLD